MESERPDPDQLLAEVKAAAMREQRGHLKIFFGASAGVGKTFAMLAATQALRRAGTDVVVAAPKPLQCSRASSSFHR